MSQSAPKRPTAALRLQEAYSLMRMMKFSKLFDNLQFQNKLCSRVIYQLVVDFDYNLQISLENKWLKGRCDGGWVQGVDSFIPRYTVRGGMPQYWLDRGRFQCSRQWLCAFSNQNMSWISFHNGNKSDLARPQSGPDAHGHNACHDQPGSGTSYDIPHIEIRVLFPDDF